MASPIVSFRPGGRHHGLAEGVQVRTRVVPPTRVPEEIGVPVSRLGIEPFEETVF
jgi:hypothetical protein